MNLASVILLVILTCTMIALASAGEFRAYAPVLKTEPITETVDIPVQRMTCADPEDTSREFRDVALTIGEDVRNEILLWEKHVSCRTITVNQTQERIIGYQVTYQYRGHTGSTRLSYDPGKSIPIDISLSPLF